MTKFINIVCLDNPFPADYGGALDMMGSIEAFKKAGYNIILHIYFNNRRKKGNLAQLADEVYFYKRSFSPFNLFSKIPFIIKTY